LIDQAVEAIEFARKNTNGRQADRRLANRRLQPLGHLTDPVRIRPARGLIERDCPHDCPWIVATVPVTPRRAGRSAFSDRTPPRQL